MGLGAEAAAAVRRSDEQLDVISLTLPDSERYATVARILVGGLAARLDLTYEALDDVQLAVETVLGERRLVPGGEITVELAVADGALVVDIGPVDGDAVRESLSEPDPLGLRVVLSAVVDAVLVEERESARWLRLVKRAHALPRD
jgi:hypothetical protein